jgi:23S rRNA pseudouridine2605 synthase
MERKDKSFRKKTDNVEPKPFNKNFYGKKLETNVGVNKNKTNTKWQPNDDLKEDINLDDFENKKRTKEVRSSNNTKFENNKSANNSDFRKKYTPSQTDKSDFSSTNKKSYKDKFDNKREELNKEITDPKNKKRSYSEYKSDRTKSVSAKDDYTETSNFKRKSIFDKKEEGAKPAFKKEYKPRLKSEAKGPSKPRVIKDPNDDSIRLNKFISNAGICSRREADELIKAGAVTVNGKIVTEMGYKIKRTDLVNYGGQGLKPERQIYILLNKPKDYITTSEDPQERRTVLELIKGACKERVYPVGRLDRNTTGLLLLTNDGELTDKITHPSFKQKKIYHVELDKPVKKEHLKAIQEGIELEDGLIKVDEIKYVEDNESKKEVGVTLHSGRNRIVRRIFEHFEYKVKKLDRVYFAGLTKKDLARGRWRFLTPMEINMLKMVQ